MRARPQVLTLAALLVLALSPVAPAGESDQRAWPPVPEGTRVLLLATGGDFGYIEPKNCEPRQGGSLYRPAFDAWLAANEPRVERFWLSAGNVASPTRRPDVSSPRKLYNLFERVGYDAALAGISDLQTLGAAGMERLARRVPFPTLACNVVDEKNRPVFPEAVVLQTAAGRVAVVGAVERVDDFWPIRRNRDSARTVDPERVVPKIVDRVRAQADTVVLLAQMGQASLRQILRRTKGLDLVLAQSGTALDVERDTTNGVPVVWLGLEGVGLGRVALGNDGRVVEALALRVRGDFPVDPVTGRVREPVAPPARR